MRFEWEETKRFSTRTQRGIDFADLEHHFDWDMAAYRDDNTRDEPRTQAIGYLFDRVVVIVYTMRDDVCRIISARIAEPKERRSYER